MFKKCSPDNYQYPLDKIAMKTLVHGKKTLMSKFCLQQGAVLPSHSHPHEQTGYLISGRISLTIGDNTYEVESGDSWCIDCDKKHSAMAIEDSVALEVFSPVREDYLA